VEVAGQKWTVAVARPQLGNSEALASGPAKSPVCQRVIVRADLLERCSISVRAVINNIYQSAVPAQIFARTAFHRVPAPLHRWYKLKRPSINSEKSVKIITSLEFCYENYNDRSTRQKNYDNISSQFDINL